MHGLTPPELFPPMRERPSLEAIRACLARLDVSTCRAGSDPDGPDGPDGRVWDWTTPADEIEAASAAAALRARRSASAVARYLGSIVMSDLAWLVDEEARETLWATASRQIAERCGRTAMGEITRRWRVTGGTAGSTDSAGSDDRDKEAIDLILCEPAIVGDSLGFKTWGTAYVMACMLPQLAATRELCHLGLGGGPAPHVLELGAGTGLLGLAAAALWRADVVLTDLAAIVPNLAANVARNTAVVERHGGRARAAVLQWGGRRAADCPEEADPLLLLGTAHRKQPFSLVLAADALYDDGHAELLASAIDEQLASSLAGRALVMVPLRDGHTETIARAFVLAMAARSLVVADEGRADGQDTDWSGGSQFLCCWWVFRRMDGAQTREGE
ncbi:glucose-inducible sam-dependent methyltransferase [Grosmannia clavigera kw1407]|uniref:Glucose-inducible sam-dependent methyltransferase n=1 Tax=Grosmannia clavigera (strain kw1407 / UAMH 11150) TaxID=655863 RepID=F0XAI7_GROCL|nr:glucose-inducible sam-dependent methyltransferase [Grosmannia clavigera kw1407]EFX06104.1 glucose-inducible sam-dependent methyltransferase [Grosmannia clavigera kw1407]